MLRRTPPLGKTPCAARVGSGFALPEGKVRGTAQSITPLPRVRFLSDTVGVLADLTYSQKRSPFEGITGDRPLRITQTAGE